MPAELDVVKRIPTSVVISKKLQIDSTAHLNATIAENKANPAIILGMSVPPSASDTHLSYNSAEARQLLQTM